MSSSWHLTFAKSPQKGANPTRIYLHNNDRVNNAFFITLQTLQRVLQDD